MIMMLTLKIRWLPDIMKNDRKSVEIMIRSTQDVLKDLIGWGADFKKDADGNLLYTREGAHSAKRIVFHEDVTGKEITSHLLAEARKRENIKIMEYTTLVDIVSADNVCYGGILCMADGTLEKVSAEEVVLATGGVGGVYRHSTNFRHLTGDGIAMAIKHGWNSRTSRMCKSIRRLFIPQKRNRGVF